MAYIRVNWENLPSKNTPVNADNLNKMDEGIANAVEKTGDTMTGALDMQNNSVKFSTTGNIEWKEYGYGDKFRIIPDFNGAGANNKLIIQSTTGEAETDPQNWKDLVTIHADSGGVYNGVSGKKLVETSDLLNLIYPVGSIYMSVNSTSPANLFGGTWEQIEDRFLLSAGNSYANGSTGGSATHSHSLSRRAGANFRKFGTKFIQGESTLAGVMQKQSENNKYWITDGNNDYSSDTVESNKGIGVSLYGNTDVTTNLPPYLAVYMWKRTA